jgi:hypothetical protein
VRRFAFNVLAVLSVLVFALSICIWVRSYFVGETFQRVRNQIEWQKKPFGWAQGRIGINRTRAQIDTTVIVSNGWQYNHFDPKTAAIPRPSPFDRVYYRFGKFRLRHTITPIRSGWISEQDLSVPVWIFLPAAVPPLLWRRRRRRTLGPGFPITPTARDQRSEVSDQPFRPTLERRLAPVVQLSGAAVPHSGHRSGVARRS